MTTHVALHRRVGATLVALTMTAAVLLVTGNTADAAVAATVPLGTSANYSVLGAATVTNTGGSVLAASLGVWPGTSITGFPPGLVLPPGTTDTTNAAAKQAQADLTVAYLNAKGRSVDATTTSDLANLKLKAGVYSGPNRSPLFLSGPLVLDGAGDPNSVFIFQTDSTLITGSSSTVSVINGAQACNVFWQVGSSATLGTGSVFTGNILALSSITVTNSVTVHGRALARTAAVTLDNDTFTRSACAPLIPTGDTGGPGTVTTIPGVTGPGGIVTTTTGRLITPTGGGTTPTTGGTTPTGGGVTTTTRRPGTSRSGGGSSSFTGSGGGGGTTGGGGGGGTTGGGGGDDTTSTGIPRITGPPRTGGAPAPSTSLPWMAVLLAGLYAASLGATVKRADAGTALIAVAARPSWRR